MNVAVCMWEYMFVCAWWQRRSAIAPPAYGLGCSGMMVAGWLVVVVVVVVVMAAAAAVEREEKRRGGGG